VFVFVVVVVVVDVDVDVKGEGGWEVVVVRRCCFVLFWFVNKKEK
jgi:hypothetical protein